MSRVDFAYDDAELCFSTTRQALRELQRRERDEQKGNALYRAVLLDGEAVGHIQVCRTPGVGCCNGYIGILLVREACGRGIGSEAMRQMVEMAFRCLDITRLTAIVYGPNYASSHMIEKLGFYLEATLHREVYKEGQHYDTMLYGLLREETGIPCPKPQPLREDTPLANDERHSGESIATSEPSIEQHCREVSTPTNRQQRLEAIFENIHHDCQLG